MTLGRVLAVHPGEGRRVFLLFLHYVWVVSVTIAGKSVRDVYFLTRYDRSILPLMAVAAAMVSLWPWPFSRDLKTGFARECWYLS